MKYTVSIELDLQDFDNIDHLNLGHSLPDLAANLSFELDFVLKNLGFEVSSIEIKEDKE